jgi:hypothetical protein
MTKGEWLAATDPRPMLHFARTMKNTTIDRGLRLFIAACLRFATRS